jgi:hypothetical protein
MPFLLFLLYFIDSEPREAARILIVLILSPLLIAASAGAQLGITHPSSRKDYTLTAFVSARPVASAEIVAVKLRVAALTTLVAWALIALAVLAVVPFSQGGGVLVGWTRRLIETQGVKGGVLLALIAGGLPTLTWVLLINQLWAGLSGRRWIVVAKFLVLPTSFTALCFTAAMVLPIPDTYYGWLLAAVPWAAGLALLLKLGAGAAVAGAVLRRGLAAPRTLALLAVGWVVVAAVVFGLAWWLTPQEVLSPFAVACAAVLLGLPLVRLGLAPLALDWNRCR